jgi:hypothetical protein
MGEITVLWVVMLIIAVAAFAPLGLFIYRFSQKAADPLGTHGPKHEPDPKFEALVNKVLGRLLTALPAVTQAGSEKPSGTTAVAGESAVSMSAEPSVAQAEMNPTPEEKPVAKATEKPAAKRSRKAPAKPKS